MRLHNPVQYDKNVRPCVKLCIRLSMICEDWMSFSEAEDRGSAATRAESVGRLSSKQDGSLQQCRWNSF